MGMSKADVVDAMYTAAFSGDVDGALAHCAPDAEYSIVTPGPASGKHSMRTYFTEILPTAIAEMGPTYEVTRMDRDEIGDLVVARVTTTHGKGVLVYRVVDNVVTDFWVINALGRETTAWF